MHNRIAPFILATLLACFVTADAAPQEKSKPAGVFVKAADATTVTVNGQPAKANETGQYVVILAKATDPNQLYTAKVVVTRGEGTSAKSIEWPALVKSGEITVLSLPSDDKTRRQAMTLMYLATVNTISLEIPDALKRHKDNPKAKAQILKQFAKVLDDLPDDHVDEEAVKAAVLLSKAFSKGSAYENARAGVAFEGAVRGALGDPLGASGDLLDDKREFEKSITDYNDEIKGVRRVLKARYGTSSWPLFFKK